MPRQKDAMWEHATIEGDRVRCNFCQEKFKGGITRMKYHLARTTCNDVRPCTVVPDEICDIAKKAVREIGGTKTNKVLNMVAKGSSTPVHVAQACTSGELGSLKQKTIFSMTRKKEKEDADINLVKEMIVNNISFNVLRNEVFVTACAKIAEHGPGYVPPSSETARTKILSKLKEEANDYVESVKVSWIETGCTIMSYTWTDGRKRPHINLLAACPKGVVFLKSECTVGSRKTADFIAKFISSGIEEIGAQNVVQFVSDNASNYIAAGYMIEQKFPHIMKTSCAAHCLDLMLESIDELPLVKPTLEEARKVVKFIYKYQQVLDLMRTHTNGRELKRPGMTRFATQFICVQGILNEEEQLRYMVASSEWRSLSQYTSRDGVEVTNIIQGNDFWLRGMEIMEVCEPLIKVLRMVDGDGSTIGYLYAAMNKAKESIKAYYKNQPEKFMPYWKIINDRWDKSMSNDLNVAAAVLNPYLFYYKHVILDKETKPALEKIIQKMVSTPEDRKSLTSELLQYVGRKTSLFTELAINGLNDAHPRIWWEAFGAEIPMLQKLAIKILSQPCSASACERNWSAFEAAHTKKRNRLEPKKLHDLVFVRMNLHMKKTSESKENNDTTPISLENINAFDEMEEVPYNVEELNENTSSSSSASGKSEENPNEFQLTLES